MAAALRIGVAMAMVIASLTAALGEGLANVRWEYRPLLLFTPDKTNTDLSRQTTMLADAAAGIEDRRLAVYVVERDRVFTLFGAPAPGIDHNALRDRFSVPDRQFRVVLIGLDGGAKLRSDTPITMERLFAVIDGMPMRRRELRERGE